MKRREQTPVEKIDCGFYFINHEEFMRCFIEPNPFLFLPKSHHPRRQGGRPGQAGRGVWHQLLPRSGLPHPEHEQVGIASWRGRFHLEEEPVYPGRGLPGLLARLRRRRRTLRRPSHQVWEGLCNDFNFAGLLMFCQVLFCLPLCIQFMQVQETLCHHFTKKTKK